MSIFLNNNTSCCKLFYSVPFTGVSLYKFSSMKSGVESGLRVQRWNKKIPQYRGRFYENKSVCIVPAFRDIFHSVYEPHGEVQMSNKTVVKVYKPSALYSYIKIAKLWRTHLRWYMTAFWELVRQTCGRDAGSATFACLSFPAFNFMCMSL